MEEWKGVGLRRKKDREEGKCRMGSVKESEGRRERHEEEQRGRSVGMEG